MLTHPHDHASAADSKAAGRPPGADRSPANPTLQYHAQLGGSTLLVHTYAARRCTILIYDAQKRDPCSAADPQSPHQAVPPLWEQVLAVALYAFDEAGRCHLSTYAAQTKQRLSQLAAIRPNEAPEEVQAPDGRADSSGSVCFACKPRWAVPAPAHIWVS